MPQVQVFAFLAMRACFALAVNAIPRECVTGLFGVRFGTSLAENLARSTQLFVSVGQATMATEPFTIDKSVAGAFVRRRGRGVRRAAQGPSGTSIASTSTSGGPSLAGRAGALSASGMPGCGGGTGVVE